MKFSMHTIVIPDYPQPGECLLYNTRSQAMIKINIQLKDFIDRIQDVSIDLDHGPFANEMQVLHKNGILVKDQREDYARLRSHLDQVKFAVNPNVFAMTILTTYACNFKCSYCFEEPSRVNERMSMATAENTIQWLKRKILEQNYRSLYLNYYGGEPLLNKPILEHISASMKDWCLLRRIPFKFMIQTNGYLMRPELVEYYKQLGLSQVRISVDGVGKDHDKYRPLRNGSGSFEVIMNNIMDCCETIPIGLSVSFEKSDVSHIERLLEYCAQKGIIHKLGRFIFSPIHATLGPAGQEENIQNAHCNCNYDDNELVHSNQKIRTLMNQYGLSMKPGLSASICPVTRHESGGTIDQQGRIYKCNSMLGHPELSTGNVVDNEYNDKHFEFLHLDVFNQCPMDCTYMPICSGGCRLTSFLDHKNYTTPSCHKPYLNRMAPDIIKQEYQKILAQKGNAHDLKGNL